MKYSFIYFIVLSFFTSFYSQAYGVNKKFIEDGIFYIRGGIVEPACVVSTESENQTIDMGVVSSNKFHQVGSRSIQIPFFIKLTDCNKNISDKVSLIILGNENSKDKRLFNITEQVNSASGVGIALYDDENEIIKPNVVGEYNFFEENESRLKFKASYLATEEHVKGGKADAVVWFVLNYN